MEIHLRKQETPVWAVPYGQEFWKRAAPKDRAHTKADRNTLAPLDALDLGDIIERVSHALRWEPTTGQATVRARTYTASFDGRGFRFAQHLPVLRAAASLPTAPNSILPVAADGKDPFGLLTDYASHPSLLLDQGGWTAQPVLIQAEATFRTMSIRRGSQVLYAASETMVPWSVLGNTAQAQLEPGGGLVEHWETRAEGVAVTWVVPRPLPGTGTLRVEVELAGLSLAGQASGGYHYADPSNREKHRAPERTEPPHCREQRQGLFCGLASTRDKRVRGLWHTSYRHGPSH